MEKMLMTASWDEALNYDRAWYSPPQLGYVMMVNHKSAADMFKVNYGVSLEFPIPLLFSLWDKFSCR